MTLYYVANARMPSERAYGIQLAKMAEAFVKAGVDFTLVLPWGKKESIEAFYGLTKNLRVVHLPTLSIFVKTRIGFNTHALSFGLVVAVYLFLVSLVKKGMVIYSIDLDQFSYFLYSIIPVPYVMEMHGVKRSRGVTRMLYRRMNGIIAVSERIRRSFIEEHNVVPERVVVERNGVDLERFNINESKESARRALGLKKEERMVLYGGRGYDWKGISTILAAAEKLENGTQVVIVGASREEIATAVPERNIPRNVHCIGSRPYDEMPKWFHAADVLVLSGTKKNDYSYTQTSPMKLFEYLASRRPIVACRTPAVAEVVTEREVFFYEPDNENDLAAQINLVLRDESEREKRVKLGYEIVKQYSLSERTRRILSFIEKCKK